MDGSFEILNLQSQAILKEICDCNEFSSQFGLTLKEPEIRALAECRQKALYDTGRIEFGGGILPKLIYTFCDSPYLDQENYATTLAELQEAFYYYKEEAQERFSDDELIDFMVKVFHGRAQGSTEYLIGTSLDALCRYANNPYDAQDADEAGDLF